ncbi:MAG: hypothetical protein VX954_03305 [Candidatus Thermoplasmatota archaeon]|nr:hypothetical protein [Candidatus Thermoplasmatota archaeon]
MFKSLMVTIIILVVPFSGCMGEDEPRDCREELCFPLSSDEFNDLLSQAEFDVLEMASSNDRLRVRSTMVQEFAEGRGEIHWEVAKDEKAELSHISTRYIVNGVIIQDWGLVEGPGLVNIRSGSPWFQLRDESIYYEDPFFALAAASTANPSISTPPFSFDISQFYGLSWDITGDAASLQQVATSSNETHEIFISMTGEIPEIMSIEVSSGDDYQFSLVASIGDEFELEVQQNLPRIHMPFIPAQPGIASEHGTDVNVKLSEVSGDFRYEANLSDIEIHSFSDNGSLANMRLSAGQQNITMDDGTWWEFLWLDVTHEGLFSRNDIYKVRTNSTEDFQIRFYDIWGEGWTDDNFPDGP